MNNFKCKVQYKAKDKPIIKSREMSYHFLTNGIGICTRAEIFENSLCKAYFKIYLNFYSFILKKYPLSE